MNNSNMNNNGGGHALIEMHQLIEDTYKRFISPTSPHQINIGSLDHKIISERLHAYRVNYHQYNKYYGHMSAASSHSSSMNNLFSNNNSNNNNNISSNSNNTSDVRVQQSRVMRDKLMVQGSQIYVCALTSIIEQLNNGHAYQRMMKLQQQQQQ